jgi:GTPase SAR1 family protein
MHPDEGFQNFKKLCAEYATRLETFNEAETRAKVIDRILKECLGWDEASINRENHVDSGYIDYELKIDGICRIVIEAKKAGTYFEIPRTAIRRSMKVGGALWTASGFQEAANQVRAYCNDIGCKYAVISNGHQFVVFSAITIGKRWTDGYCIAFSSLEDIASNFSTFWNILNPENVKIGSLIQYIDTGKRHLTFRKPISEIHNPEQSWARNDLYTYIRPLSEIVFSELLDEKLTMVLKECYVFDKSNSMLGTQTELENFFIDHLPHFANRYKVKDIIERDHKAGAFQKTYLNKIQDPGKGCTLVILGGIGCGKSTFIHRFFKIILAENENLLWFYIDFRDVSINEVELESHILQEMIKQWDTKYKDKLESLLIDTGFSITSDTPKTYFEKLFNLLRRLGFSITLIIDNLDQHDVNFQEKIFILASHLTNVLKTVTIIALREETFVSSTRSGVFDAYDIPKFHVASPNFLNMIRQRLQFAITLLKEDSSWYEKTVQEEMIKYFSIIYNSLTEHNVQARKLVAFIDSVSVGNMRDALLMFNYFIVSGNTNVKEIFRKHDEFGSYQIAYHQFIKSIILGEHKYYSQERSHLMNLFDFDSSLTDSHFNLLRILNYLNARSNKRAPTGRGYVDINSLISLAEEIAIRREVIRDTLLRLSQFSLVEFDNQSKIDIDNASCVKITYAGKYYLTALIFEFVYLDTIWIDTPISDDFLIHQLKTFIEDHDLDKRLQRTEKFVNYLKDAESTEFKEHPEYVNSELTNNYFGKEVADKFPSLMKEIKLRASHDI